MSPALRDAIDHAEAHALRTRETPHRRASHAAKEATAFPSDAVAST